MIPFISSHLIKMVGISSKLWHHAPPLLQAFDLSNKSFSLLQNSKVASFSVHHSIILTKSPSFPPHSFLPQNLPVGNFPSMASSDEWIHHHPLRHDGSTHNPNPKKTHPASTNVASSLMQIKNKLEAEAEAEAEAGVWPTPPTNAAIVPLVVTEESSGRSSTCTKSKLLAKEIMGNALATSLLSLPVPDPEEKALGVRRRQELEDFILKLEEERRRELIKLAERHPVSQFLFQSDTQSLIRLRSLRQKLATVIHQQWSQKLQEGRFEIGSNSFFLRKRLEERELHDINEVPIEENMFVMEVQQLNSHIIVFEIPFDYFDSENNHLELVSAGEIESSPQAFYSIQAYFMLPSRHKDRQESQILDFSWDKRNLWQRPSNSHILRTWHDDVAFEGIEKSTQEQYVSDGESNWLLQPSNSRRG